MISLATVGLDEVAAQPLVYIARFLALGLLPLAGSFVLAFTTRVLGGRTIPPEAPLLTGLAIVAGQLHAIPAFRDFLLDQPSAADLSIPGVLPTFLAVAVTVLLILYGRRAGDRLGENLAPRHPGEDAMHLGRVIVEATGRFITVRMPDHVEDLPNHAPVPAEIKAKLVGREHLFPRGLTVEALEERIESRLQHDLSIPYVDVDVDAKGHVRFLAVGGRETGIGPTLKPDHVAVALRALAPPGLSPGDVVEVHDGDAPAGVGLVRHAGEGVVTLDMQEHRALALAPSREYRLTVLPYVDPPETTLLRLLRETDRVLDTLTVASGSPLDGAQATQLPLAVLAIERAGQVLAAPEKGTRLKPGDVLYVLGSAKEYRKLVEAVGATPSTRTVHPSGGGAAPDVRFPQPK